jgi:hypothetical protein
VAWGREFREIMVRRSIFCVFEGSTAVAYQIGGICMISVNPHNGGVEKAA